MTNAYLEVISFIGRVHRQFLEVVKLELDGMGIRDINNVQAMMLFNIGEAEMTVGELTLRGCYLGSNVSYNVKNMVEEGYLVQQRSVHDRRSVHVRLTEKGKKVAGRPDGRAQASCQPAGGRGDKRRRPSECRDHASPPRAVLEPHHWAGATVATRRLTKASSSLERPARRLPP